MGGYCSPFQALFGQATTLRESVYRTRRVRGYPVQHLHTEKFEGDDTKVLQFMLQRWIRGSVICLTSVRANQIRNLWNLRVWRSANAKRRSVETLEVLR